ncbi:hypothetical protein [Amycolatopsis sp. WQ 127309]|uniref:hypothetical protein n=1 Tax=Amycolatopsis sp. WQ 127309 TaxID=2932773 RepID=UPI001FF55C75|nr:hypothetical protein [Amycolatopsis sp. WQ 127309]UOZ09774.1 hypothetical protein MUY22_16460 [Amycolatopsis sp. WQ 127309]
MDEDYARLLRDWLRADPGTPRPRPDSDDVAIPLPRRSEENRRPRDAKGRTAPEVREGAESESRAEEEDRTEAEGRIAAEGRDGGEPESRAEEEGRTAAEGREGREPESRSAAEERSRWNHPSNWHRRKAAERAEIGDRVAEPEVPRWPLRDPDIQAGRPSRSNRLDEQRPWRELDDAIDRSRREELDATRERNRSNDGRNNDNDDPEDRSR